MQKDNRLSMLIKAFLLSYSILNFCLVSFSQQADTVLIKSHLTTITKTKGFRNYQNMKLLNKTADFIFGQFSTYADSTWMQTFDVQGNEFKNVICSFGPKDAKRIIVGAHYDVCGSQEGADDNASGVVGLLELARLLKGKKINYRIDLVAYTLEEPPFFRSDYMGSYIHAKSLKESNASVYGMISIEMIGYFQDEKKTQEYPLGILSMFYGSRGNYITLVKKYGAGKFTRKFCKNFKQSDQIRTKKFTGPKNLVGIDFSDHLNYWKMGYSALMLTDTSFFRNKNYHQSTDKMETLDYERMAKSIDGVLLTLLSL